MNDALVDRISGGLGVLLAGSYIMTARGIEDSLLADGVGASGVPMGVGIVLLLASFCLFVKSLKNKAAIDEPPHSSKTELPAASGHKHPHAMALGLLLILALYVCLLPFVGYVVSVGILVAAVAWFAGARSHASLVMCSALAGPVLWLVFDWALEIRLPAGLWSMWLGK